MNAAQIAHHPQKETGFLRHSLGCIGVCLPTRNSSSAQQPHGQCRCGGLEFSEGRFAGNEPFSIPGFCVQEYSER